MQAFFHGDVDGLASAAIIDFFLRRSKKKFKTREYHPIQYGDEFPFEKIEKDELVFILDYSIEPEEMKKLLEITDQVYWIDHHVTAIEKYQKFNKYIKGLRSIKRSGAYLTWEFFATGENTSEMPQFIKYVDDFDRWIFKYDESLYFNFGITLHSGFDPTNPLVWDPLFEGDEEEMTNILRSGEIINSYKEYYRRKVKFYKINFEGLTFAAINTKGNSKVFEFAKTKSCDALMLWYFDGVNYNYSLYHEKNHKGIDLSKIASKYGGGGHAGASGFSSKNFLAK